MTAERLRWLAIGTALMALACDARAARDAGVRRVVSRPAPRPGPATVPEPPPGEPPFDFRLAEWMPEVYIDSTRHCRMVGFEAQRRRSVADCTTGTWARGAL